MGLMNYSQHSGKVPNEPRMYKMEFFRFWVVLLPWILSGSVGNHHPTVVIPECKVLETCLFQMVLVLHISCAGSVVLTQTHPVAPYVCRTGNITLRCHVWQCRSGGCAVVYWWWDNSQPFKCLWTHCSP